MNIDRGPGQRITRMLPVYIVLLLLVGGCTPVVAAIEPPALPNGMAGVELDVAPADLALSRTDMPAGFQLAAEKDEGPEYVALYLRPSALDPQASGGNTLFSILTSVGVYTASAEADEVYRQAASDLTKQAGDDIGMVGGVATNIMTTPFEGAVQGGDAAEAFRVTYSLMQQPIYEYGHRFRVGNVLAYVVIAAIGNPDEPEHLLEDAHNLVQRQVDHIVAVAEHTR